MAQSDWSKTSSRDVCIQVNSDFELDTLVHLKEVFMILHYRRTRI